MSLITATVRPRKTSRERRRWVGGGDALDDEVEGVLVISSSSSLESERGLCRRGSRCRSSNSVVVTAIILDINSSLSAVVFCFCVFDRFQSNHLKSCCCWPLEFNNSTGGCYKMTWHVSDSRKCLPWITRGQLKWQQKPQNYISQLGNVSWSIDFFFRKKMGKYFQCIF